MATKRIIDFYYYLFFQWGLNVWRLDHIFAQNCRRPFSLTIYFFNEAHRCYLGGSMFFADLQPRIYGFVKRESEFWLWLPTLKKKKIVGTLFLKSHWKSERIEYWIGFLTFLCEIRSLSLHDEEWVLEIAFRLCKYVHAETFANSDLHFSKKSKYKLICKRIALFLHTSA